MSKGDLVSWGLFGLGYGAIVGLAGHNGVLGHAEGALVNAIVWGLFGLAAGALYGLWAGRGMSARRMQGARPLLPPGTSTVLAWAEGDLTKQAIDDWSAPGSQQLILHFNRHAPARPVASSGRVPAGRSDLPHSPPEPGAQVPTLLSKFDAVLPPSRTMPPDSRPLADQLCRPSGRFCILAASAEVDPDDGRHVTEMHALGTSRRATVCNLTKLRRWRGEPKRGANTGSRQTT
jgi:hypothetical protein